MTAIFASKSIDFCNEERGVFISLELSANLPGAHISERHKMKFAAFNTTLLAVLAPLAIASEKAPATPKVEVQEYQYGMQLDIDQVLQRTDNSRKSGVVPSVLVYRDSQGEVHAVRFMEWGGLSSQNG